MRRTFLAFTLLFSITSLFGQALQEKSQKYCTTESSIGTGTYDPVSYFKANAPRIGKSSIKESYDGVTYYFESERNRKDFKKNPVQYLPQFGGWCSMTLAMGKTTRPTYSNFLIQDGKLYLFERTLAVNGKELWLKSPEVNYANALKNYNLLK